MPTYPRRTNRRLHTAPTPLQVPALEASLRAALRAQVPAVAELTVTTVAAEVPQFAGILDSEYRRALEDGVRLAYDGFVALLGEDSLSEAAVDRIRRGAYALGRQEARARRSVDTLLTAYRVGTRVHWQELSQVAAGSGVDAPTMGDLAALILAYNHELSAASVAGYNDETATLTREAERRNERLALAIISGEPADALVARAHHADWPPPESLTAVLLPPGLHTHTLTAAYPRALTLPATAAELGHDRTVVLIRDAHESRAALLAALSGTAAVVGPARPWVDGDRSYARAVRALSLPRPARQAPLDTEEHLAELVLTADADALADLRAQALRPLADLPPATVDRLAETLRAWLLHQGRREAVAAQLNIHAQTVRYRMDQIRQRYGQQLTDPEAVLSLTVALAVLPRPGEAPAAG